MRQPQFIIMTSPRTGSTVVCDGLGHHPEIKDGMEMFHERHAESRYYTNWRRDKFKELYGVSQDDMTIIGNVGQTILDPWSFDFVPFAKAMVEEFNVFKMMYHQVPVDAPFWDFYLSEVPLKIIYMNRNFLDSCVSFFLAIRTGVWQRYVIEEEIPEPPITISLTDLHTFYKMSMAETDYRCKFDCFEFMDLNYEEICNDWEGTMEKVQRFLGLDPVSLPQRVHKKATKPTVELIENYEELQEALGGMSAEEYVVNSLSCSKRIKMP